MNRRHFIRRSLVTGASLVSPIFVVPKSANTFSRYQDVDLPIRLDSNENPLGISKAVQGLIQNELSQANRYPFSFAGQLVEAVALHHGIDRECVVLGAGSSEVLQMVVQAFCNAESLFISSTPTFEVAENVARSRGVQTARISLTSDHRHDLEALKERSEQHPGTVLVYLCNPNNPTATLTPTREMEQWIGTASDNIVFLVDEAYHEYVESPDYYSLIHQAETRRNLIVTRSFSKIYALAGLRVGYGVAHPGISDRIAPLASAGSVNTLGILAAVASLQDREFVQRGRETNKEAREILFTFLKKLNLSFLPSHTNFVMFRIHGEIEEFISRMGEAGIYTGRPFPPMRQYCRISMGLPEEMEYVGRVLLDFRNKGWI